MHGGTRTQKNMWERKRNMARDEMTIKNAQQMERLNMEKLKEAIASNALSPIQIEAVKMILRMTDEQAQKMLQMYEKQRVATYQT